MVEKIITVIFVYYFLIKDINRLKNGLCKINNKNLVSLSKSQKNENEEIFMNKIINAPFAIKIINIKNEDKNHK